MTVSEHSHQPEGLHPRQLARLEEHVRHAPLLSAERLLQAAYAHLEDVQGLHVQRPEVDADLAATICHILDRVVSDWDSFTPVEQSWFRARCSILPKKMTRCLITPNAVSTTMLKCSMPAFGSPGGPIGYCRLLAAPDSGAAFGNTPDTPRSWLSAAPEALCRPFEAWHAIAACPWTKRPVPPLRWAGLGCAKRVVAAVLRPMAAGCVACVSWQEIDPGRIVVQTTEKLYALRMGNLYFFTGFH